MLSIKGDLKKGMDQIKEKIKELEEELSGLIAIRDAVIAGAAREFPNADDEDEDEDPAEAGDGE